MVAPTADGRPARGVWEVCGKNAYGSPADGAL